MSYLNPGVENVCECNRWKGEKCGRRKTGDYLVDTWMEIKQSFTVKKENKGME